MAISEEVEKYCRNYVPCDFINDKDLVCRRTREFPAFEEEYESFERDEELERLAPSKLGDFPISMAEEEMLIGENLSRGVLYIVAAYAMGAVVWGLISASTSRQTGFMPIAIGFTVGFAMRKEKGMRPIFGIIGVVLSLASYVLGDFFSITRYISQGYDMSYFDVLVSIDYREIFSIMLENVVSMAALFYGFTLYEGYKFSFRAQKHPEGGKI